MTIARTALLILSAAFTQVHAAELSGTQTVTVSGIIKPQPCSLALINGDIDLGEHTAASGAASSWVQFGNKTPEFGVSVTCPSSARTVLRVVDPNHAFRDGVAELEHRLGFVLLAGEKVAGLINVSVPESSAGGLGVGATWPSLDAASNGTGGAIFKGLIPHDSVLGISADSGGTVMAAEISNHTFKLSPFLYGKPMEGAISGSIQLELYMI